METGIVLKLVGWEAVKRRLDKIDNDLKKSEVAYKQSTIIFDLWIQDNFKTEGGKVVGWKQLADSTLGAISKTRRGGVHLKKVKHGPKILQGRSGWLKSHWKPYWTSKSGGIYSEAEVSGGVYYGVFHNSDKPRKRLPQRRILPYNKEVWPTIKKIFEAHLGRAFRD